MKPSAPAASLFVAALALVAGGTCAAATLDVAADGADLVFTWDAGVDDLLRGTSPDDLRPWLAAVTSPLRVPNENALRGESAFYRLASGSNMGFRIERTFGVDSAWGTLSFATTLPERRAYLTSFELLAAWPTLVELIWWDGAQDVPKGAIRTEGLLIGDDETLPVYGGVWLAFSTTTTVTLVGSHDDALPGPTRRDTIPLRGPGILPLPYHARWTTDLELLCGTRIVDWQDADDDGLPDDCGRDTDFDGRPDTGLWHGALGDSVVVERHGGPNGFPDWRAREVFLDPLFGTIAYSGLGFDLALGDAYVLMAAGPMATTSPFRPPTW